MERRPARLLRSKKLAPLDHPNGKCHHGQQDPKESKENAPKGRIRTEGGPHACDTIRIHKQARTGAKPDPQADDGYSHEDQQSKDEIDPTEALRRLPDCSLKDGPHNRQLQKCRRKWQAPISVHVSQRDQTELNRS